jgi:pyruvate kinase
MLESTVSRIKATRTEASDVSNSVLDGADALVLSSETTVGFNPVNSVHVLARICAESERCIDYKQTFNDIRLYTTAPLGTAEAIASSSVSTVLDLNIDLIICVTDTGCIARLVAKYRPPVPVLACSAVNAVIRNLQTVRGVWGFKIPNYQSGDNIVQMVVKVAKEQHLVKSGGKVVVIQAQNEDTPEESNVMKIVDVE